MTIPRQLGPATEQRSALPDYSRSSATVERMVADLRGPSRGAGRGAGGSGPVRALHPAAAMRDTVLRAAIAAVLLGGVVVCAVVLGLLLLGVEEGRSPGVGMILVLFALGVLAVVLALLGVRFGIVALGTARSRVEVREEGLTVVGALGSRQVAWRDLLAIESRVVHPVHWHTAALRLRDGTRVIMPAFDRHIWTYGQPSGEDIRRLRIRLHEYERSTRRAL